jgi:modulator of FtsH protease
VTDAFRPDLWHDFFIATAGASAALTGLLFVGLSLHIRYIASNVTYRDIARGNMVGLVMILVLSLIALIHQPVQWTGIEVAVAGAVYIVLVGMFQAVTWRRRHWQVPLSRIVAASIGLFLSALGIVAGVSLYVQAGPGLFLLAFLVIVLVPWTLRDAWFLLLGVADAELVKQDP